MRDDEHCLGGAFFPWMCAGAGEAWGWTLWGEDADWGVVTHELLPKANFWALRSVYSPVLLPARVPWTKGGGSICLSVRSLYHKRDLAECTFRTMMGPGGKFMGQMRSWRDISVACPPGGIVEITVPIWNATTRKALDDGLPAVCRCIVLEPSGFRSVLADVLIVPEGLEDQDTHVVLGPDANLAEL